MVNPIRRTRGVRLAVLVVVLMASALSVVVAPPPATAFGTSQPQPIPSISAGGYMSCGVKADGTAACWGENGMPSNDTANTSPGGAATPPAGTFLEVNAGHATACGVRTDQSLVCWGSNRFNKLVVPSGTFTHVVPGLNYACGLRTDGTIACWGGDDPAVDPDQKVIRDVPAGQFSQVTVGTHHACALRADGSGTVVCWGHNTIRLGVNEGQTVVPPGTYSYVNVSNFTSCALRTDGTPVCWARNLNGQQTYPTDSSGPLTFTQVSTGNAHVCGLRPDRTVVCWGRNSEGQASPVPPGTYTQVTAGTFHSCGMREGESTAVCWGDNMSGRVQPNMRATSPQQGYVGFPYSFQFAMNPSPIAGAGAIAGISPSPTFSMVEGALPAGLSLSPGGLLSGTPTAAGSYPIKVAASNGLSPPDCAVPVNLPIGSQSMPCVPGDSTSVATATRAFTITISADAPPPGTIAGVVTAAANSAPIAGATISVSHTGGAPAGEATSAVDGSYSIADLTPGSYSVKASGTELQPQTKPATVVESQTTTVNFALTPLIRPTITSVWNNHFDTVTDGLFIEWSEEISPFLGGVDRPARYTVHSDDACTTAAIATGAEAFWVGTHPARRDLVLDTRANIVDGGTYHLRVMADTELGMDTQQRNALACVGFTASLSPADSSALEGTVTAAAGGAIAGATVTVTRTVREPGTVAGQTTTQATGNYQVDGLAPGDYSVRAAAPGYSPSTSSATTEGGSTTSLHFTLNAVPAAVADAYTHYGSDTPLVVSVPGVLSNDTDAESNPLRAVVDTGPRNGALVMNQNGSFTYQPNEDFLGTDSFTYRAFDATGQSAPATVTITVGAGCRGLRATITGTSGNDTLIGTNGNDVIVGLAGDDQINAGGGNDVICGGSGADSVNAGSGDDYANGGSGNDSLRGDVGNDTLIGGDGADKLNGDDGNDILFGGPGAPDTCNGGNGVDSLPVGHGCEKVTGI